MAPKSLPERSWGASGAEKKTLGTSKGALGEFWSEISSKMEPGYHGTGSAFEARAASKASEARARRSQETLHAERAKEHEEEQARPRAGQQEHRDSEPGHAPKASRRRCAPPPRRLELGAFPEFSCGFLAAFRLDPGEALGKLRAAATRKEQRNQSKPRRTAARTAPNAA